MKKARKKRAVPAETSLARYDWSRAQRGRYAARFPQTAHAVVIPADVYEAFGSAEAVNEALALVLELRALAVKPTPKRRRRRAA